MHAYIHTYTEIAQLINDVSHYRYSPLSNSVTENVLANGYDDLILRFVVWLRMMVLMKQVR